MTVEELVAKHGLTPICLSEPDREISGCYIGDLLSWVMGKAQADNVWITIMNNINTLAVASLSDVALIILTENVDLDDTMIGEAKAKGINVAGSSCSSFEVAVKISSDV